VIHGLTLKNCILAKIRSVLNFTKNSKSLLTGLLCVAFGGLFFPINISNIAVGLLLLGCIFLFKPRDLLFTLRNNPFLMIFVVLYAVQIIGLSYTENMKNGFFVLEKKIAMLLMPCMLIPAINKSGADLDEILKKFGFISLGSSVVLLLIAAVKSMVFHDPNAFYYEDFTSIHYVYYAIYFACGSLFVINAYFDQLVKTRYGAVGIGVLFIYSLAILTLVASKTGLAIFGVTSTILLYAKIRNKRLFVLSFIVFIAAASVLLYFNPTTRNRFVVLSENLSIVFDENLSDKASYVTGLNMRLIFWRLPIVQIFHDNLALTGVGTGDAQDFIDDLLNKPPVQLYGYIGWDSHNQWVFGFIQLGLIGLLPLGFLYFRSFKAAMRNQDTYFMIFLLITLGFSFTESILESNKGIIFFSLVLACLASRYTHKEITA
jgi:O-antigen ligase